VSYDRAIEIVQRLTREQPTIQRYQIAFADANYFYFKLLLATGRLDDAEATILQATDIYEQVVQQDPTNWHCRERMAAAYYRLGHVQRVTGRLPEAEATYRLALELYESLASKDPSHLAHRRWIGAAHFHIGLLKSTAGQQEAAVRSWITALENFRAAAKLGPTPPGMTLNIAEVLAQLDRWKEAADTLAASIDDVDYAWKPRCQLALLQWMAGDEAGYRATRRELISRHSNKSAPLESTDDNAILEIARQAASASPPDLGTDSLVGAALYRAGKAHDALAILERLQPMDNSKDSFSSPQLCVAWANRALGEAMLARIYRELGKEESFARQLEKLRSSIDALKSAALQHCDDGERWRIGLAVLYAERELAKLQATIKL
jgi:tetratricopeptide (TPR) repeat protein